MNTMDYVSIERLATKWDVSRQTVLNWINEKKLKAQRFGSKVYRVPIEEVRRFENADGKPAPPDPAPAA